MNGFDRELIRDQFEWPARTGRVVDARAGEGVQRLVVDPTRSLAIDNGALRVVSLRRVGWGTASIGYPATELKHGAAFGALILNGHNTAQSEPLGESLRARFKRWMRGNDVEAWRQHVVRWCRHGRKRWTLQRFQHWVRVAVAERRGTLVMLDENLAVGLVPALDSDPLSVGSTFVMHATGYDNGELWAVSDGRTQPVLPGVRNVPLYLLVVAHEDDVVFFGSSVPGVRGLPPLPFTRPLAVMRGAGASPMHPAILQSVSGQIGFAADTRVWESLVATVPNWVTAAGNQLQTGDRDGRAAVGLLRVLADSTKALVVTFRSGDAGSWRLIHDADTRRWTLECASAGAVDRVAGGLGRERCADRIDVQITDDGERLGVTVDGALVFGRWIQDRRHAQQSGFGVIAPDGEPQVSVWPRLLELPPPLAPATAPPRVGGPFVDRLAEDFTGGTGDLAGRSVGTHRWERTTGSGRVLLTGTEARVDASAAAPLPGRLVYSVPSPADDRVELEIEVVPPGVARGNGERGRAGVVFEQADGDSLIVSTWLDDGYEGASISSFFRLGGFEDLYDAIWTNVGRDLTWGQPYKLRVAFDGLVYEAYLNDELVIYRSLDDVSVGQTRLKIDRVGIVANWEWGTDTGSVFRRFVARAASCGGVGRIGPHADRAPGTLPRCAEPRAASR